MNGKGKKLMDLAVTDVDKGWTSASLGRDAKVLAAQRILAALCPLRQGSAVIQTTNLRGRPRTAPGIDPKLSVARSQVTDDSEKRQNFS
jgi:hypothetical protein